MTCEAEKGPVITGDQLLFRVLFLNELTSSREKVICLEILVLLELFSDVIFVYFSEFLQCFSLFEILIDAHQLTKYLCPIWGASSCVLSLLFNFTHLYLPIYYLHNILRASQVFYYWFIALNDITTRPQLLSCYINNFIDHISS